MVFFRDYDTQMDIFRYLLTRQTGESFYRVNDAQAAVFIVDIFLWIMAAGGYTLQKTRTKFNDINEFRDIADDAHQWNKNNASI